MKISYFDIQWFSKADGPGSRVVLFLQGCHLRCPWCHLPHSRESQSPILFNRLRCLNCSNCLDACENGVHVLNDGLHELHREKCIKCGKCIGACPVSKVGSSAGALFLPTRSGDTLEVFNLLLPQLQVIKNCGGLTVSGGEALLQKEAVVEILRLCKSHGIHTALETSLTLPLEAYQPVSEYVDCWLVGMRDISFERMKLRDISFENQSGNGSIDESIIDNVRFLSLTEKEVIARYPVIKGFNESRAQLERFVRLMGIGGFKNIEVLPCNKNMAHYYILSGIELEILPEKALPGEAEINGIVSFFEDSGLNVKVIK